jgi:hypothetical protein
MGYHKLHKDSGGMRGSQSASYFKERNATSTNVVHALAAADAVDECRLLVIPTALGAGERLFVAPVDLQLTSIEIVGEAVLARYDRTARA